MSEQAQARDKEQLKKLGLGLVVGFVIPVLVIAVLAKFLVVSHDTVSRSGPAMSEQAVSQRLKPVGQLAVEGAAPTSQPAEAKPAEAATPEERIKPVGEVAVAVAGAAPAAQSEAPATQDKPAEKPTPAPAEKPAPQPKPAEQPAAAGGVKTGPEVYKTVCSACHDSGAAGAPKLGDKAAWGPRLQQGLDKLSESAIKGKGAMPPKGGAAQLSETEVALAVIYMSDKAGGAASSPAEKAPEKAAAAAPAPAAAAPAGDKGKKTYEQTCAACHATGAANAPKFGDKAAWGPRIAAGKPALYNSALKGKGAMPAKGGNAGVPDDDVKAAVDYMVSQAK